MGKLDENFMVKRIGVENREGVLNLVVNHYSGNNMLHAMLKCDLEECRKVDANRAIRILSYGLSVGMFEKNTNRLVGICLNATEELGKPHQGSATKIVDPNIKIAHQFIDYIEKDMLQLIGAHKVLLMQMSTLLPEYRKQGLSEHLIKYSLKLAQENGCDHSVTTFTTAYFPKSLGFQTIKKVKYSEYVDEETGLRPFNGLVVVPHEYTTVAALPVPNASHL